ncbi:MAG: hypothetical protein FWF52_03635 [Candidatus Azobacteroides sp.]|nr:hypothetical protein [Candidatus Azobacteroides sp.]
MMTARGFGMGFFGRNLFDKEARKKFQEEWFKMSDSEKLDFMNKRVEHMGKDHFSVEAIDARCEEWMKKTPEEKEAFIKERKEAVENRFGGDPRLSGDFCEHGFGFGRR